jgi:hypothetical protein
MPQGFDRISAGCLDEPIRCRPSAEIAHRQGDVLPQLLLDGSRYLPLSLWSVVEAAQRVGRTVPVAALPGVAAIGVGITTLFAVFDSHDAITFAHEPLSTPSGDVRLVPVLEALTPLAGQPALAWVPGRQIAADGGPWPYDQRGVLERQVAAIGNKLVYHFSKVIGTKG